MRPQVVRTSIRDFEIDKRAERKLARNEDQAVDLRRVPSRPSNGDRLGVTHFVFGFADRFDEDLQRLPDQRLVLAQRD